MPSGEYFDPNTGYSYTFGEGQQPPDGWKPLNAVPDPLNGFPPGTTVTWLPGYEPRLFVDPVTGKSKWVHGVGREPKGWLPLSPLASPPPLTIVDRAWFYPKTGESYVFGSDQSPPDGWKKLKPIPSPTPFLPPGSTVTWIPGHEPLIYVDPSTGDVKWIDRCRGGPPGWIPLRPRFGPPPLTTFEREYFDPATGESHVFGSGESPPPNWKKLNPTPPQAPFLPPGSTVTWIPGREPLLYVDPATGDQVWVHPPEQPPTGWRPLRPHYGPLPQAANAGAFFDPATGEAFDFGPGGHAPDGWKLLSPTPPQIAGVPPGATVTWAKGFEPKLFVNSATGDQRWIGPNDAIPQGWLPVRQLATAPLLTKEKPQWFDPASGRSAGYAPGEAVPAGWKRLKPLGSPTPWLPPGATVIWEPGFEPKAFVDSQTGDTQWVPGGEIAPTGWLPLCSAPVASESSDDAPLTYSDEQEIAHRAWLRRLSRLHDLGVPQPPLRPRPGRILQAYLDDASLARKKIAELTGWFDTFERHRWEDALAEAEKFIRIYEQARPKGLEVAERAVNQALRQESIDFYVGGGYTLIAMGAPIAGGEAVGAFANTPLGRVIAARIAARMGKLAERIGQMGGKTSQEIDAALARAAAREATEEAFQAAESGARISKGARVLKPWRGGPKINKDMIAGRRSVPKLDADEVSRLYAQSTRAAMGEEAAWKAAVFDQGEVGLQAPGHANAKGVDFITAIQRANGEWEIIVTDVKTTTTGAEQAIRTEIPPAWDAEIATAVSPAKLNLDDPELEAAIREAYLSGRVSLRRIVVDYSREGQGAIRGF